MHFSSRSEEMCLVHWIGLCLTYAIEAAAPHYAEDVCPPKSALKESTPPLNTFEPDAGKLDALACHLRDCCAHSVLVVVVVAADSVIAAWKAFVFNARSQLFCIATRHDLT